MPRDAAEMLVDVLRRAGLGDSGAPLVRLAHFILVQNCGVDQPPEQLALIPDESTAWVPISEEHLADDSGDHATTAETLWVLYLLGHLEVYAQVLAPAQVSDRATVDLLGQHRRTVAWFRPAAGLTWGKVETEVAPALQVEQRLSPRGFDQRVRRAAASLVARAENQARRGNRG